jgi:predicted MFS family arabinose efflux permease
MVDESVASPQPPQPRMFGRAFLSVICAQMSFNFGFSTYLLLPKYLSTELGAQASDLGMMSAVQGVVAVMSVPFIGGFLDRVGRRPLMAAGAGLMFFYSLAWLGVDDLGPLTFALQIVSGLAFMLQFSAASTLSTDLAPEERLSQAIGIFGAANITMNAVAPAIAEPVAQHFGWRWAFALAAASSVLALFLTRAVSEPVRARQTHAGASDLAATFAVAKRLWPFVTAMASCGAAFGAVFTFYQPWVLAQGAKHVSLFFVGFTLAAVSTRVGLGSIADRFGRRRVALRAFALYAVVVLAMTLLTPGRLLGFGMAFGFAHGFFYPALNALALEGTVAAERGRAMTLVNGAFHLGNTIAALGLGWVAHSFGYEPLFVLASLLAFVGLGVLYTTAQDSAVAHTSPAE